MAQQKQAGSKYGKFYRELNVVHGLQTTPQEREWLLTPPRGEVKPADVVLYLGCNVLRTSHMIRTVVDIFKMLDVNFVTVGGTSYCCGNQHFNGGDDPSGRAMATATVRNFQKFQPERVVMWCPSCIYYYDDIMDQREVLNLEHVTEFLLENLDRLEFKHEVKASVALHYHTGRPQSDIEAQSARRLLSCIPGLNLVDVGTDPRFGRHCTERVRSSMGPENWDNMAAQFFNQAVEAGADVFSPLYHGCHRMLCGYEKDYPFKVEHYLTLVGRSLGIEYPDLFKKHMLLGDVDAIMEETSPCATANGISQEEARAAIQNSFAPKAG
jgi:heterodisulfide reductase subunit D